MGWVEDCMTFYLPTQLDKMEFYWGYKKKSWKRVCFWAAHHFLFSNSFSICLHHEHHYGPWSSSFFPFCCLLQEGTNNVRMLSAASVNGFTILTFQRKLGTADIYDKTILTNGSQPVIWAVGPIKDGLAQYHSLRNKGSFVLSFQSIWFSKAWAIMYLSMHIRVVLTHITQRINMRMPF